MLYALNASLSLESCSELEVCILPLSPTSLKTFYNSQCLYFGFPDSLKSSTVAQFLYSMVNFSRKPNLFEIAFTDTLY